MNTNIWGFIFHPTRWWKLFQFLGRPTVVVLLSGAFTGIIQFAIDVLFIYGIQGFLIRLNIIALQSSNLPQWLPEIHTTNFLYFLGTIVLGRGSVQWAHGYLVSATFELQRLEHRKRLINWIFRSLEVNSGEATALFNEHTISVATLANKLQGIVIYLASIILVTIYLLQVSVLTTLLGVLLLGIIAVTLKGFDKAISKEGHQLTFFLESLNRRLLGSIKNLLLVQIYGTQKNELNESTKDLNESTRSILRYQRLLYLKGAIPQTLGFAIICFLSAYALEKNWLSPANAITFFYLFLRFVQGIGEIIRELGSCFFYLPSLERMYIWWSNNLKDNSSHQYELLDYNAYSKPMGWRIEELSYTYPGERRQIFEKFNDIVPADSMTVLMGASGSGKSTLVSLLLGFTQPSSGKITLVDKSNNSVGVPYDKETHGKVIKSIGYVGPESFLFPGTIYENLCYGLNFIPQDNDLKIAMNLADCSFINQLPKGLQHRISEQGHGLSAGQKQRICLARAILRKPKILILDEATANLDKETELRLIETFKQLKGSMTILAVTHREALLNIADHTINLT